MSSFPGETGQSHQNGTMKPSCLPASDAKTLAQPVAIPPTSKEIPNSIPAPAKDLKDPAPGLPCNVKKPIHGTTKSGSATEPNNLHVLPNPTNPTNKETKELTKSQTESCKVDEPPVKVVNPLRLARPLEAAKAGLSRTTIPPTRPMPLPTVSPLCPPGSVGKSAPKPPAPFLIKTGNSKIPEAISTGKEKLIDKKGKTEDSEEKTDKKDESEGLTPKCVSVGSDIKVCEIEKNKQIENVNKSIKTDPRSVDTPAISSIQNTNAFTADGELQKNEQMESIPKSIASKEKSEAVPEIAGKPPALISVKNINTLKEGSSIMQSGQKEDKPGKETNDVKEEVKMNLEDVGAELESDYPHYYDSVIPNVPGKKSDFWFPLVVNQIPKEHPIPSKLSEPVPLIRVKNMDS